MPLCNNLVSDTPIINIRLLLPYAAAKNAVRRKEVQVNGSIGRTDSLMKQGDLVQIVVKVGNGAVWPSAEGKCKDMFMLICKALVTRLPLHGHSTRALLLVNVPTRLFKHDLQASLDWMWHMKMIIWRA